MRITDTSRTIRLVLIAVMLMFALLAARLWQLQIIMGDKFDQLSHENRLRFEKVPSPRGIIYDRNGKPLVKNSPYFFVELLPEMADKADLVKIAEFLNMDPRLVVNIVGGIKDPIEPIRLKGGLRPDEVAFIEARVSDHPGLIIEAEETRHYIYGPLGAHFIGYLGKLNPQQASRKAFRNVPPQAFVGQWGVEKMYDSTLRGKPGKRTIEVDALGRRLRLLKEDNPVNGQDVYLSIDINLQRAAEEAFGNRMGALVAIKPDTGEVLALVSRPSFNPNLFSRGIDYNDWVKLSESPRFPLLNRALQSNFPPGSTFKIVTALAALEENSVNPRDKSYCNGFLKKGRWNFRCWRRSGHGAMNMFKAIVESCDVYFYLAGEKTGIDNIAKYARKLGLDAPTGLGLVREKRGLIPDTQWKMRTRNQKWYPGETYNAAIGQGFVLTTPIQLAQMIATVANGGHRYPLRLLRADQPPEESEDLELDPKNVEFIKSALRHVVTDLKGTGHGARSRVVAIAGKTGTAQVVSQKNVDHDTLPQHLRDHAWFVAFAPVDNPQIALAVFVENGGHGGATAAPIARKAIEAFFTPETQKKATRPSPAPLAPEAVNPPVPTAGRPPVSPANTPSAGTPQPMAPPLPLINTPLAPIPVQPDQPEAVHYQPEAELNQTGTVNAPEGGAWSDMISHSRILNTLDNNALDNAPADEVAPVNSPATVTQPAADTEPSEVRPQEEENQ